MPVRAKINCRKTRRFDGEMVRKIIVLIGSLTKLLEGACHQVKDATAPEVAPKRWLSEVRVEGSAQGVLSPLGSYRPSRRLAGWRRSVRCGRDSTSETPEANDASRTRRSPPDQQAPFFPGPSDTERSQGELQETGQTLLGHTGRVRPPPGIAMPPPPKARLKEFSLSVKHLRHG
jgi:hypothetical protein